MPGKMVSPARSFWIRFSRISSFTRRLRRRSSEYWLRRSWPSVRGRVMGDQNLSSGRLYARSWRRNLISEFVLLRETHPSPCPSQAPARPRWGTRGLTFAAANDKKQSNATHRKSSCGHGSFHGHRGGDRAPVRGGRRIGCALLAGGGAGGSGT